MSDPATPNFGVLLAPLLQSLPQPSHPALLAGLERRAAQRYRGWAEELPEHREDLMACATREDEIARRAAALFPIGEAEQGQVDGALPEATRIFLGVFEGLPLREQLRIQADAERQGAAAWRGLGAGQVDASVKEALEGCAVLEEASASLLESLLASGALDAHGG